MLGNIDRLHRTTKRPFNQESLNRRQAHVMVVLSPGYKCIMDVPAPIACASQVTRANNLRHDKPVNAGI